MIKKIHTLQELHDLMNKSNVDSQGLKNVTRVLESGFLSKPEGGDYVKKFQENIAVYFDKKFAFATTSGTASLHAAVAVLGLNPLDEVLVPAVTFMADASVVIQEGAKPVFVDVLSEDLNIDPDDVEKKITKKTKAIIVVHLYGRPANLDRLMKIAKKYNLVLIEDCAQAFGARYKGKRVGSYGDLAICSFYQTKHLVCGEGGMVLTDNKRWADKLKSILNNGIKHPNVDLYDFDNVGFNYQMTEMQAALGVRQLERIEELNLKRRERAQIYVDTLLETGLKFIGDTKDSYCVYCYQTAILPKKYKNKRNMIMKKLKSLDVPIKNQYPMALSETELARRLKLTDPSETPIASELTKRVINLFVHPGLDINDVKYFATSIKKVISNINN